MQWPLISRSFAPNAYAAYVRDPDGHKIVVVFLQHDSARRNPP